MKEPVFLNESPAVDGRGDFEMYRSVDDLTGHVEAIDVENDEYFVYDAEGRLMRLETDGENIWLFEAEDAPTHAEILAGFIRETLPLMNLPNGANQVSGEWLRSASLNELISRWQSLDEMWEAERENAFLRRAFRRIRGLFGTR